MALPPNPPGVPARNPFFGGGFNPGLNNTNVGADRLMGVVQSPQYTFPDYNGLLAQYMAPFRAIYEAQIAALQENIARQQEYAKKQEALGLDSLGQQHGINDRDITNTLTARGLAESGEPTYRHGIENKNFSNAKSSMENQLANTLAGLQAQADQAKFSGLMGLQQQQLGLLPFIQNTYQPTIAYPFKPQPGPVGAPPVAPPFAPPAPASPAGFRGYR